MLFNQPWKPDFNGDGKTDIFWRNDLYNKNQLWLMDGARIAQASGLPDVAEEQGWRDLRFGDFDGNGTTDLFWRNTLSGDSVIWFLNGSQISQAVTLPRVSPDWSPEVTDFNGDGKTDLFWQNQSTGQNSFWIFDGARIADSGFLPTIPLGWKPLVGDFNGDGKGDIFWRNNLTGQNSVWTFNGRQITAAQFLRSADLGWNPTIGDLDGDGRGDILWNNPQLGQNQVWFWSQTALKPEDTAVGLTSTGPSFNLGSLGGNLLSRLNVNPSVQLVNFGAVTQGIAFSLPQQNQVILTSFENRQPANIPIQFNPGSLSVSKIQLGDFDNDGIDDLIVTSAIVDSIIISLTSTAQATEIFKIDPKLGWKLII